MMSRRSIQIANNPVNQRIMKRIVLVFSLGLILLASSCQKEYTCVCTTDNPLGGDDIVIPHQIDRTTKSKAEDACQQKEDEENASPSAPQTTCVLE